MCVTLYKISEMMFKESTSTSLHFKITSFHTEKDNELQLGVSFRPLTRYVLIIWTTPSAYLKTQFRKKKTLVKNLIV